MSQGPVPALLHIHGGGYVLGVAEGSGPSSVRTAAEVGCVVVSVDYRLAPETVAPGAVEDCYAALRWLYTEADDLGIDRSRIAAGGESAGGGLAAALALLARDRGEYPLCFQLLIYPMIDDRTVTPASGSPNTGEFVWTRSFNRFGWRSLLGEEPGGAGISAYAAPARADNLADLPPTYISVGALDLFLDENIEYARRLLNAGVPTELHVLPGAYHGFELAPEARVTKLAETERRSALARAFERL
jgi:acetyl esterase/lipase